MKNINEALNKAIEKKFIKLPKEELILVERKHWLTYGVPIAILVAMGLVLISVVIPFTYSFWGNYLYLLLPSVLLMIAFISSLSLRSLVDWYFNLYILTNRKIMEVSYRPLSSHQINEVMLDQVKCTEIDTKIEGMVNDILDIGHVMITFDRPTHQDAFVMEYVNDPREIKNYVQSIVNNNGNYSIPNANIQPGWFSKSKLDPSHWIYTEEIINKPIEKGDMWN